MLFDPLRDMDDDVHSLALPAREHRSLDHRDEATIDTRFSSSAASSGWGRIPQGHGTRLRDNSPHRDGLVTVLIESIAWIKHSVKIAGASSMLEVIFFVEESPEGGYTARALGTSIFTEADDWGELQANVRDAVNCHFDEDKAPKVIRLHFVREEVLTL
jgi:hypothetical protein